MANVTFEVSADTAKAVQGFLKIVNTQKQSTEEVKRTNRPLREQDDLVKRVEGSVGKMLLGFGAINMAVREGLRLFQNWEQNIDRLGQKLQTQGGGFASFAFQQPPGTADPRIRQVQGLGASFGVGPDSSVALANAIQPTFSGNFGQTLAALDPAFRGIQAGIPASASGHWPRCSGLRPPNGFGPQAGRSPASPYPAGQ